MQQVLCFLLSLTPAQQTLLVNNTNGKQLQLANCSWPAMGCVLFANIDNTFKLCGVSG